MAKSQQRCWPGYEPVPGKPAHSQGSCRPKAASKLKSSERTFRAKRKRQLDRWSEQHPGSRRSAAQHLSKPGQEGAKKKRPSKRRPSAAKSTAPKRTRRTGSTAPSKTRSTRARTAQAPRTRARKTQSRPKPRAKRPTTKRAGT